MDDAAVLGTVIAFGSLAMIFPVMTRWRYARGRISAAAQGDNELIGLIGFVIAAAAVIVLWAMDLRRRIAEGYLIDPTFGAYAVAVVGTSWAIALHQRRQSRECLRAEDILVVVCGAAANLVLAFLCFWGAIFLLGGAGAMFLNSGAIFFALGLGLMLHLGLVLMIWGGTLVSRDLAEEGQQERVLWEQLKSNSEFVRSAALQNVQRSLSKSFSETLAETAVITPDVESYSPVSEKTWLVRGHFTVNTASGVLRGGRWKVSLKIKMGKLLSDSSSVELDAV